MWLQVEDTQSTRVGYSHSHKNRLGARINTCFHINNGVPFLFHLQHSLNSPPFLPSHHNTSFSNFLLLKEPQPPKGPTRWNFSDYKCEVNEAIEECGSYPNCLHHSVEFSLSFARFGSLCVFSCCQGYSLFARYQGSQNWWSCS